MDKKELKQAYKNHKPDMGVYAYKCKANGKVYIGYGQDLKGDINSTTFKLKGGNLFSKSGLQDDWTKHGENNFEIQVLEVLACDKDETKTDYTADLLVLRGLCADKFLDFEFIQK